MVACEKDEATQLLPKLESQCQDAQVVFLVRRTGDLDEQSSVLEWAPCFLERGPDIAADRVRLFPVLGRLVAREEERQKLQDENQKLQSDVERCLASIERTGKIQDRLEFLNNLNYAKTEFLSFISHKMRTPLTAIIGFAEMLSSRPAEIREEDQQMIQSIWRMAIDMGNFLNDAIEYLQRASGNISLSKTEFDVIPHLQKIIKELTNIYQEKKIRVAFRGLNALKIVGDAQSITSAIERILDNAFKFSKPGGTVEIGLHEEIRSPMHGGNTMVLKILDHGIGLHRRQIEKLFNPVEAYSSDSDRSLGHGLGLAIAREVIQAHGGRISVKSNGPNKGCLVVIELMVGKFRGSFRANRIPLGELQTGGSSPQ